MAIVRYVLVLLGVVLCCLGLVQIQEGLPGYYYSRGIAELQSDANALLLGIAWLIGGLASGVFALAFPGLSGGTGAVPGPTSSPASSGG